MRSSTTWPAWEYSALEVVTSTVIDGPFLPRCPQSGHPASPDRSPRQDTRCKA